MVKSKTKSFSESLVPVCPKCGGTNLTFEPISTFTLICKDCNYTGACPEIDVSEIEGFRKKLKRRK